VEFIRRFLLHVLPRGLKKIRYFGFLSPRYKNRNIELIRKLADVEPKDPIRPAGESVEKMMRRLTGIDIRACPKCGKGRLTRLYELLPVFASYIVPSQKEAAWNTS
jgi:predicted transcriptional regulator